MLTKIEMQAMEAVIGIHREMRQANEVDWEQRRYEIAKEYYCRRFDSNITTFNEDARRAVECADILISELKNKKMQ